jgi:hypothetical protein
MITGTKPGYKLIPLPEDLIKKLQKAASKKGLSISTYSEEQLEEALNAENNGVPLNEAVESYRLLRIQLASGQIQIPRQKFDEIVHQLYSKDKEKTLSDWFEAGKWFGEYLRTLFGENAIDAIGGILKISWNLNEVEILREDMFVNIRFVSFILSEEMTELLVTYVNGLMCPLGYKTNEAEYIRGLAKLGYQKVFHKTS